MVLKAGRWMSISRDQLVRGTTRQVCGLWPFAGGAGAPRQGVPVGKHMQTGATVALDPITYFQTGLIANPSLWIEGKPGLGKSTLTCRICIGMEHRGVHNLILGDLKGEYVTVARAMNGQVITTGRGRGGRNPLDHSYATDAAYAMEPVTVTDQDDTWWVEYQYVLGEKAQRELLADSHARRLNGVEILLNIQRHRQLDEIELVILERALIELQERWAGPGAPIMRDLLRIIDGRPVKLASGRELPGLEIPRSLREVAMDRGSLDRYMEVTEGLRTTLTSIADGTAFGGVFSGRSEIKMRMDRTVVFDVSSIDSSDTSLQAAVLLTCWNEGFGQVETMQVLADEGVIKRQNYHVVLDELWRPLTSGPGMVDRISASTRLNRTWGIGITFITHSLADLDQLPTEEDRVKARGIAERCGVHVYFGLPRAEMRRIAEIQALTRREEDMVVGWWTPESWVQVGGKKVPPPGLSKFLLKVAGRRGVPVKFDRTVPEATLHDTNNRWAA